MTAQDLPEGPRRSVAPIDAWRHAVLEAQAKLLEAQALAAKVNLSDKVHRISLALPWVNRILKGDA